MVSYLTRGGMRISNVEDLTDQNFNEGAVENGVGISWKLDPDNYRPVLLTGLRSATKYSNIPSVISALLSANGDIALRTTTQGKALTMASPTFATIAAADTAAVAANANRRYLLLVNTSANNMYLAFGTTAVSGSGIFLLANGGSYEMSESAGNLYTGAIRAIAAGAGSNLSIQEGT